MQRSSVMLAMSLETRSYAHHITSLKPLLRFYKQSTLRSLSTVLGAIKSSVTGMLHSMSIMNLFATSLLPDYSSLYIVRSLELDEAITVGAQVDGAVGRIVQSNIENDKFLTSIDKQMEARNPYKFFFLSVTYVHSRREVPYCRPIPFEKVGAERWTPANKFVSPLLALYVFGAIPIAIIGIWTRFDPGKSTKAQRVWTMLWLVMDISSGPVLDMLSERDDGPYLRIFMRSYVSRWYFTALTTIPAIGGFVVVAQMLRAYGTCVQVSGVDS